MSLRVVSPTFAGNATMLRVGGRSSGLPPGSEVVKTRGGRFAWVRLHDGSVHAFVAGGEVVPIPAPLSEVVANNVFTSRDDDPA